MGPKHPLQSSDSSLLTHYINNTIINYLMHKLPHGIFLSFLDSFCSQLCMCSLLVWTQSSSWVIVSSLNPPCSLIGSTGLILGKLVLVFMQHSWLSSGLMRMHSGECGSSVAPTLFIAFCNFLANKQSWLRIVISGAVETSLPCNVFVILWLEVLFKCGTHVLALLWGPLCVCCSGHNGVCRLCFRADRGFGFWRSECSGSWGEWGPQESRSLSLHSMLTLTSSVHCALWMAFTLRRMESRVKGWWRPLFFIRSQVSFSLSITDFLDDSQCSLTTRGKKNQLILKHISLHPDAIFLRSIGWFWSYLVLDI